MTRILYFGAVLLLVLSGESIAQNTASATKTQSFTCALDPDQVRLINDAQEAYKSNPRLSEIAFESIANSATSKDCERVEMLWRIGDFYKARGDTRLAKLYLGKAQFLEDSKSAVSAYIIGKVYKSLAQVALREKDLKVSCENSQAAKLRFERVGASNEMKQVDRDIERANCTDVK